MLKLEQPGDSLVVGAPFNEWQKWAAAIRRTTRQPLRCCNGACIGAARADHPHGTPPRSANVLQMCYRLWGAGQLIIGLVGLSH